MGMLPIPLPPGGGPAPATPTSSGPPAPLASAPAQAQDNQPNQQVKGVVDQFTQIHAAIKALASQFPDFAEDGKKAIDDLNTGMVKIISTIQGGAEVQSPNLGT